MHLDMPAALIMLGVFATIIAGILQWTPRSNGGKYVTIREFDQFSDYVKERISTLATKDDVQGLRDLIEETR